jgi:hypothetical protein
MTNLSLKSSLFGVMAVIGLATTAIASPAQASREKILPTSSPAQQRAIIAQSVGNQGVEYFRIYAKNHNPFPIQAQVTYRPLGWTDLRTGTWNLSAYEEAYLTDTTWSFVRFYAAGGGKTWGPHTEDLGNFYTDYIYNFYR